MNNFVPLEPRNPDGVLRVVSIARLSKENPDNENESLDASLETIDRYLNSVHPGPKEIVRLSEQISGMVRDRDTIRRAEDLIDAGPISVETKQDVESRLGEVILHVARTSHEFASLLRRLITRFEIVPMLAVDSGQVRPRAYLTVSFQQQLDAPATHIDGIVDLFEPPVHFKHLAACRRAKQENPKDSLKTIAAKLGINYMTVKRSLDLARRLETMGISEPYQELRERPDNAARWRQSG